MLLSLRNPLFASLLLLVFTTLPGLPSALTGDHPLRPREAVPPHDPGTPFRRAERPRSPRQEDHHKRLQACSQQWQALKARGQTNGMTWPDFNRNCRDRLKASGH